MRILISNDDGVYAPGIAALHEALADFAECAVVAPSEDQSGVSSALTLDRPLYPERLASGWLSINGTPADCVHLGLNGLLDEPPELVVSGINLGANLGDDVLYSGTVAAAMEGRFLLAAIKKNHSSAHGGAFCAFVGGGAGTAEFAAAYCA